MAEIIACPECQRQFHVDEKAIGDVVQCPKCARSFLATPLPKSTAPSEAVAVPTRRVAPRPVVDVDDDDPGDFDVRGPRRRRPDAFAEEDDDWPARRYHRQPHRAHVILILALLSMTGALPGVVFATIAFFLGRGDLRAMDEGRMDPSGRGMTQAGMIIGAVMAILDFGALLFFGWWFYSMALF